MFQQIIKTWQTLPPKLRRNTDNKKYLAEIDGLRFLAIFPVLIQHLSERMIRNLSEEFATPILKDQIAFAASRGTIGVFIFFAISGFILTLPFAKHYLEGKPKISYKSYLGKRLTRLEPPYIIWMSFFFLVLLLKGAFVFDQLFPHFLTSIFYCHNLVYGEYSLINPVAWSLEIEIQFYLIAPFLVALFFSISNKLSRRWILVASIFGFLTIQHNFGWMLFPLKASLLGQLQHFLVGMLLADFYLLDWRKQIKKEFLWDGLAVIAFVTLMYTWTSEYLKSLIFVCALFLLLMSAFKGKLMPLFLKNSWISAIGGMCYTIYLIHLPLMELLIKITGQFVVTNVFWINLLVQMAICLPVILGLSILFYLLLEKPFMGKIRLSTLKTTIMNNLLKFLSQKSLREKQASFNNKNSHILAKTSASFRALGSKKSLNLKYSFIVIIIIFMSIKGLFGQMSIENLAEDNTTLAIPTIPNLDSLINYAMEHSPLLKVQDKRIEIKAMEQQLKKKDLLDKISVGGSVLFGTGTIYDARTDGETPSDFTSYRRNVGYNTGLNIRITAGDIVKGKEKRQLAQLELEKAMLERKTTEHQIREEVIRRYDDLDFCISMIDIKVSNLEAMKLALEVAETYFKNGNLPVSEYSTTLSKKIKAEEELVAAKARTVHCWRVLKEIAGMN